MSSDNTYGGPSGANNSTIEYAENALINGVSGKKVFITGTSGTGADVTDHGGTGALNVHTPDITITDTLTSLNDTVEMDIRGMGSCLVQVSGTWTGKIEFQGAIDGVWNTLSIFQPTGAITRNGIQNDNQNGLYRVVITSGYTKVRAIMTTYSSGTATIMFNASTPVGSSQVWQLNAANLNATVTGTVTTLDTVYATKIDTASSTITYIGEAVAGSATSSAVWRIKKLDTSSIALSTTWADGNSNQDNIWDNRSSLTYT